MMARLINAEFIKLRTTQVWFWLLLAAVAIAALFVIGPLASRDGVQTTADAVSMFTGSVVAYVAVFVLGVLGVTTEFRYQTITPTVLATPSRWALITAKMITYAIVGAVYAAICLIVQLAIAVPWLSAKGIDFSLSSEHAPRTLGGVFVVVALFGIVGLGVGALLRNQIVAVTVGVIFLLVVQNLLLIIPGVRHVFPYLPEGGVRAILAINNNDRTVYGVDLLAPAGGVVVLLAWAFIPAILGASITMNRDIT
jgi:ABC-2 type transport system permease protein